MFKRSEGVRGGEMTQGKSSPESAVPVSTEVEVRAIPTPVPPRVADWRFERQRALDRIALLERSAQTLKSLPKRTPVVDARKQEAEEKIKKEVEALKNIVGLYEVWVSEAMSEAECLIRVDDILGGKS